MNFDQGVKTLSNKGLNIFLSAKVSEIPLHIFSFAENQNNKTLCLIGHGGQDLWTNISDKTVVDPIDKFSISQMLWFAENILDDQIEILFPDEKQVLKLQELGRTLGFSFQSPLGIDICKEYGLWFAYRGVFLTGKIIPLISQSRSSFPCESCLERPCLKVSDFENARLSCPIKTEHQYTLDQQKYHSSVMERLKGSN